jgi:hypothetical protein
LALANPAETNVTIAIRAYQNDGLTGVGTSQATLILAANGHTAAFADQLIAGLPTGFTGVLDISSATPFAALTLRSLMNERNEFLMTTFPVADTNVAAPSPILFPQVADGRGYTTQFVFLSMGQSYDARLKFYGENGAPLAVGK